MIVKKYLGLAIAASLFTPALAIAAPTVTFQGEVATQTSQAQVDGQDNAIVLLPTVAQSSLASAGTTAGITPFTISVRDCDTATTYTQIKTKFLGHSVTTGGNLGNVATINPAKNVSIQLTSNAAGTSPITLLVIVRNFLKIKNQYFG
ncbi:fimbrial protein [Acinetobacter seifertii]|uniref:fimbrial protein n=1 Tax=Acinetobacter seifertii TaxID=1530123 RepID=UPI001D0E6DF0|nr:fimbrial protein [Acinetobacter seifertii]